MWRVCADAGTILGIDHRPDEGKSIHRGAVPEVLEAIAASNGQDGPGRLRQMPIHWVVLLQLLVPSFRGRAFLHSRHNDPAGPTFPTIVGPTNRARTNHGRLPGLMKSLDLNTFPNPVNMNYNESCCEGNARQEANTAT